MNLKICENATLYIYYNNFKIGSNERLYKIQIGLYLHNLEFPSKTSLVMLIPHLELFH